MKNKIIFISLFFVLNSINAQKLELTEEEKIEFKNRAERMIKLFTETLTIIPSFNSETEEKILRDKAIRNTLRLFTETATMQIMRADGSKETSPIATYLNSLTNYEEKLELVHIDIIEFNIDEIRPHPTQLGSYIVSFEFVQRFSKKKNYTPEPVDNDEKLQKIEWDYVDITTKSGSAIIKKHTDQSGTKWIMLLDDVEANDIEVTKN